MLRIIDKQTKLFLRDDFTHNEETELALDVACAARVALLPLDLLVVGLEVGIADRPVRHSGPFGEGRLAEAVGDGRPHAEVGLAEAIGSAAPVQRASSDADRRHPVQRLVRAERASRPGQDAGRGVLVRAPRDRVHGHAGHDGNELADEWANKARTGTRL